MASLKRPIIFKRSVLQRAVRVERAFRALQRVNPPFLKPSEDSEGWKPVENQPPDAFKPLRLCRSNLQATLVQRERKVLTKVFGLPGNSGMGIAARTPRVYVRIHTFSNLPFCSGSSGKDRHFWHLSVFEGWPLQEQMQPCEPHF